MNKFKMIVADETVEVSIKEYRGQRVVTFKDVDVLHQKAGGTSRKTFNSHKTQFIEGEDYFVLNTDEAKRLFGLMAPNGIIALTESGYLLIVKPFTDDLSWKVQRQLVKTYFKAKELIPTSQEDILIFTLQNQKEMKQRLETLEIQNRQLKLVVDNEIWLTDHQKAMVQEAVNHRVGKLKSKGYDAHFQSIYRALKDHFSVPKYDKIKRVDFEHAIDLIKGWYPKKKETA